VPELNSVGVELMKSKLDSTLIELDGARFAVDFVQRQAHGHAHEEHLRQFDAAVLDMQEIAVVQRLQAEVVELQVVAVREQRFPAWPGRTAPAWDRAVRLRCRA
jgi:hypothetical protein